MGTQITTASSRIVALTAIGALLATAVGLAAPRREDTGSKLVFVAYGDTRPNFYPFGSQAKHRDLARAIRRYDERIGGEVDAVLVTGDFIFADVPFTSRDWKPAWKALEVLREGAGGLTVFPVLGNHELLSFGSAGGGPGEGGEDGEELAAELFAWGGSEEPVAPKGELEPILLAQLTHLAEHHDLLKAHLPPDVTERYLKELWIQLSEDAVERLSDADRESLETARRAARSRLALSARHGTAPEALARQIATQSPATVLEAIHALATEADLPQADAAARRLAREALARLGREGTDEFAQMQRALEPALAHLRMLRRIARIAGPLHEELWREELAEDAVQAHGKSWKTFKKNLLEKLGAYLKDQTSLAGLPTGDGSFTGPSWYTLDRSLPGGAGGTVRFVAINSNLSGASGGDGGLLDQERFLLEAIRSHPGPIVIFQHHPPVSIGSHGGRLGKGADLVSASRAMLYGRVFGKLTPEEQARVWAIIGGHDHDYQRVVDAGRGSVVLVSGGGGVPLREEHLEGDARRRYLEGCATQMGTEIAVDSAVWAKAYGFVACEVSAGRMEFRVFGTCEERGETMDDPEFGRRLPAALEAQMADDSKLLDHFVITAGAGGARTVEELPAARCR